MRGTCDRTRQSRGAFYPRSASVYFGSSGTPGESIATTTLRRRRRAAPSGTGGAEDRGRGRAEPHDRTRLSSGAVFGRPSARRPVTARGRRVPGTRCAQGASGSAWVALQPQMRGLCGKPPNASWWLREPTLLNATHVRPVFIPIARRLDVARSGMSPSRTVRDPDPPASTRATTEACSCLRCRRVGSIGIEDRLRPPLFRRASRA